MNTGAEVRDTPKGGTIHLDIAPVGARFLAEGEAEPQDVMRYTGISYCAAVSAASSGKELFVAPGSITLCQWSPVALGLKAAENAFEKSIAPRAEAPVAGVYLAPIPHFLGGLEPQVVLVRTRRENFARMIAVLGRDSFLDARNMRRDATSLGGFFEEGADSNRRVQPGRAVGPVNRLLGSLNRAGIWRKFIALIFKSTLITRIYDRIITRWLVNMSVCRNSTVIPFLEGRANISHFCTGAVAWGGNDPSLMTAGFPWEIWQKLAPHLEYAERKLDKK